MIFFMVAEKTNSLYDQQILDISWLEFTLSLSLVVVTLLLSLLLRLHIQKSVFIASVRAALQLFAVGLLFTAIFDHKFAELWSWLWVTFMALLATEIIRRRVPTCQKTTASCPSCDYNFNCNGCKCRIPFLGHRLHTY